MEIRAVHTLANTRLLHSNAPKPPQRVKGSQDNQPRDVNISRSQGDQAHTPWRVQRDDGQPFRAQLAIVDYMANAGYEERSAFQAATGVDTYA